jgi:hypothetical protein
MNQISHITVRGQKNVYVFQILEEDNGTISATCPQPDGGLNTSAADWNELNVMLDDCVATWEEE